MGFGQAQMSPPSGYTVGQRIFDDQFLTTSLDTTLWSTMMGAGGFLFNNGGGAGGALPVPYTGPNIVSLGHTNGVGCNYWHQSNVVVNNGCTLNASVNPNFNNGSLIGNYQYQGGNIISYAAPGTPTSGAGGSTAAFSLPKTSGWYVQANMQLGANIGHGMNYTMWFLPATGGTVNEIDYVQPTLSYQVGATLSNCNSFPLGTAVQDNAGTYTNQTFPNLGPTDYTAGFHVYGIEWIPGVSVKGFVDGVNRWTVNNSAVPGGITAQAYEMIFHIEVWDSSAAGYAWTACLQGSAAGVGSDPVKGTAYGTYSGSMKIAEVQAYSRAIAPSNTAAFALNGTMHANLSTSGSTTISPTGFALNGAMSTIGPTPGTGVVMTASFALNGDMAATATPGSSLGVNFALNETMTARLNNSVINDAGYCDIALNSAKCAITLE